MPDRESSLPRRLRAFAAPALTAALVVFCALAWAKPASAIIFFHINVIVTTPQDNDVADGFCSLREAIIATNQNISYHGCDASNGSSTISDDITFDIGTTPVINIGSALPSVTGPLDIDGNTGGAARVELRGPGGTSNFNGLTIAASGSGTSIVRLVINNFGSGDSIQVDADNVTLLGNFLGTDAAGSVRMNPQTGQTGVDVNGTGVQIGRTNGTTPGGLCTGDCNLISGNFNDGIYIHTSAADAGIEGNFIGSDVTGTASIPNDVGIRIEAPGAVVGGINAGQGNLISGNGSGIIATQTVTVQGNLIGTDTTGMNRLGNREQGIKVFGDNSFIGGVSTGARNVISGNDNLGIRISGAQNVHVLGNLIGTAADGITPLGDGFAGVLVEVASSNNIIGGDAGNTIAFSTYGVYVDGESNGTSNGNQIRFNSIHDNDNLGIELINGGNTELPQPVVNSVSAQFAGQGVSGTACANCQVDIYSDDDGQGRIYEGTVTAGGTGDWAFNEAVAGPNVTATANDAVGNTSEFSEPFTVLAPTPTPSPTPSPSPSPSPTPTGSPTSELDQGDVNCDGAINVNDFKFLIEYAAGLNDGRTPGDCPDLGEAVPAGAIALFPWGDVNCDNAVNALDALYVLRFVANLPLTSQNCVPVGGGAR